MTPPTNAGKKFRFSPEEIRLPTPPRTKQAAPRPALKQSQKSNKHAFNAVCDHEQSKLIAQPKEDLMVQDHDQTIGKRKLSLVGRLVVCSPSVYKGKIS